MHNYPRYIREKFYKAYEEFLVELEDVKKLSIEAQWKYDLDLINYSKRNFTPLDKVIESYNISQDLIKRQEKLELIIRFLNIQFAKYERYKIYMKKISELDILISNSVEVEDYEMAKILKESRDSIPEPQ